jgi:hypothetical protein
MKRVMLVAAFMLCFAGVSSAGASTLVIDSGPGFEIVKSDHGKTISPKAKGNPKPGYGHLGVYTDYAGTPANRGTPVGYDATFCVVVKWPIGNCSDTLYYQGSVLSVMYGGNIAKDTNPTTYKPTYRTGIFAHVTKVVTADYKGYPTDEKITITGVTPAAAATS